VRGREVGRKKRVGEESGRGQTDKGNVKGDERKRGGQLDR